MAAAPFSAEELASIAELRARLADLGADHEVAREHLEDDSALWRYIFGMKNDLQKAEAMFRHSMAWRDEVGMEAMMRDWRAGAEADGGGAGPRGWARTNEARLGERCFYAGQCGKTLDGGPLLVERLGKLDLPGLAADPVACAATIKSYSVYLEEAWRTVRQAGGKIRGVIVVDCTGLSMGIVRNIGTVKKITSIGPANYPEITRKVFIVNAPWFFQAIWKLVATFLPARTKAKISVLGADFQGAVGLEVEGGAAALPRFLGGEVDDDDVRMRHICPALPVVDARAGLPDLLDIPIVPAADNDAKADGNANGPAGGKGGVDEVAGEGRQPGAGNTKAARNAKVEC